MCSSLCVVGGKSRVAKNDKSYKVVEQTWKLRLKNLIKLWKALLRWFFEALRIVQTVMRYSEVKINFNEKTNKVRNPCLDELLTHFAWVVLNS